MGGKKSGKGGGFSEVKNTEPLEYHEGGADLGEGKEGDERKYRRGGEANSSFHEKHGVVS